MGRVFLQERVLSFYFFRSNGENEKIPFGVVYFYFIIMTKLC